MARFVNANMVAILAALRAERPEPAVGDVAAVGIHTLDAAPLSPTPGAPAMTGAELAHGLQSRIDTARHERSIWNYAAAEGAEKELARFCAEHRDAILAALDADMFGAAERVKRAILTAEWQNP